MVTQQLIYRFIVANVLTLFYTIIALVILAFNYVKSLFSGLRGQKLRLEPPSRLTDPKYGVHKYLKVNNTVLHYVESGDPAKPLMLFLHGFPEFWYTWRHQIVNFNKDYWCVAVDMRGYGDSERPSGVSSYKIELLIEDVRDLVRQLGREKFILIGHDWGGLVACYFRDVYPETLTALILLASASREAWLNEVWTNPEQKKQSWYVFLNRMPYIPESVCLMNDLQMFDVMMSTPGKPTPDKQDLDCYKYWFCKPFALTPPVNYYRANFLYTLPEKHKSENLPMLVAHAANDKYLQHGILDTMKKEYKHIETTIVDNVSHFMHHEEPDKVNKLIRDFLSKHNI